jgi:isopenicillin N synthase-like dioxygenase
MNDQGSVRPAVESVFSIPTIHLDDPNQARTVQAVRDVCMNVGFFYLQGHGIDPDLLEDVFRQSKMLFDLSVESKISLSDKVMSRGYTGMEEETLNPSVQSKGDTKEGFYIGRHIPPSDSRYNPSKFYGPNQWPEPCKCPDMSDCAAFQATMEMYFEKISAVAFRVVRLIALAIGLQENYFDDAFSEPLAVLRLLHYAAEKSRPDEGVFACGAHSGK